MKGAIIGAIFVLGATITGYALQDGTGICLPEVHADNVCHCLDMGGYMLCHGAKPFSYQEWADENSRRSADRDKKGKQKQPDIPMCKMSCKEDQCDCCSYMEKMKQRKKVSLTIPYDSY